MNNRVQIFLGGLVHKETDVKVVNDEELTVGGEANWIQGSFRDSRQPVMCRGDEWREDPRCFS